MVGFDGWIGSTDERGEIRFNGLPGRKSFVAGLLDGRTPPPWSTTGPMPAGDALRGRFALVPAAEVAVIPGREATLVLRARPIGYVRGTLNLADGRQAADYEVVPWYDMRVLQPSWRYDPATGDFLAGPFPSGPATLQFSEKMPDGTQRNCGRQVVEIIAAEVAHVELKPGESAWLPGPGSPLGDSRGQGLPIRSVIQVESNPRLSTNPVELGSPKQTDPEKCHT
ncbi:hypothetical protein V5E97_19120 [Singulisphaera sp. Ch08]|uniref:Uncharacterized protein n=1 Tax=Singulisphaera sp. Ch08 TaxID=3120278 RepID=A0AAU7CSF3_9BACT